ENLEEAFWSGIKTSYLPKFRREMQKNPKKKFYDLWSVEDLINNYKNNTTTKTDIVNQAEALENHNTLEELDQIKSPTLLLAASHDRLTPKVTMEQMHEVMSNSTFKVIENAGHGAPLSHTDEVNKIILEFLEE
ncbi:MAG: alpha/beta fold hydrolase, partial [Candidatus Lokiarchaeota archaeon]|nr:alpha/beta fold hydrolase [Candidatus Lokiarchaeota archaeon]MBD3342326.1 alpha/beta fold hydrolase [Candidatus Lokiarchaeota archaeon]